jgi:hypothetical protein
MLGTSGSNDFSLYGAQPDPALTFSTASPAQTSEDLPRIRVEPAPIPADVPSAAASAADMPEVPAQPLPNSAEMLAGSSQAAPTAPAAVAEPGGSITPILPAAALAGFEANALTAPVLPDRNSGDDASGPATVAAADPAPAPALQAAVPAPDAGAPVSVPSAPTLDVPASQLADSLASPLVDALPLGAAVQALPELVAQIVPADPLAPVDEAVQDLLGADPDGGIATLVSLVSISDVLDIGAVVTEDAGAALDPAPDLIELLAMDSTGESAPPAAEVEDDSADSLLGMPLPPPDDIVDDVLGL